MGGWRSPFLTARQGLTLGGFVMRDQKSEVGTTERQLCHMQTCTPSGVVGSVFAGFSFLRSTFHALAKSGSGQSVILQTKARTTSCKDKGRFECWI